MVVVRDQSRYQKGERDEAIARQMFDMFGGVPRHVFIDTESRRTQRTKMLNDLCTRVTTDFLGGNY